MLAILINRAKVDGQTSGVVPIPSMVDYARNMKLLLCAFEQASGLKINYHKSELFYFGNAQDHLDQYVELFGCKSGDFPTRYLGIPIHFRKIRNVEWRKVEERFERRLGSWKGKHLSIGDA